MKLVSWNVNGVRAVMKKDFMESFHSIAPDVMCLQETKAQDDQVIEALKHLDGYHIYTNSAVKRAIQVPQLFPKKSP